MAKKSSGKTYTSKGERKSVKQSVLNSIKADKYEGDKMLDIQRAYLKGQNPWITLDNPNKEQTNKKKIRVRVNDMLGHPKERAKKLFQMSGA